MKIDISQEDLERALSAAGIAHHDYEQETLNGVRDELWPGFMQHTFSAASVTLQIFASGTEIAS
jgi:hypothetical protein